MKEMFKNLLMRVWSFIKEPVISTGLLILIFVSILSVSDKNRDYFGILFLLIEIVINFIGGILEFFFRHLGLWISLISFIFVIVLSQRFIKHKTTTILITLVFLYCLDYWSHKQDNLFLTCNGTMTTSYFVDGHEKSFSSKEGVMKFSFVDYGGSRYSRGRDEYFFRPIKQVLINDYGSSGVPFVCQEFNETEINCKNQLPEKRVQKKGDSISEYQTNIDRRTGQIMDSEVSEHVDENGVKQVKKSIISGECSKVPPNKF